MRPHNRGNTNNQMTDSLGIVRSTPVTRWDMFTLNVPQGFSLEVFQGERHLASITAFNSTRRWDLGVLALANTVLQVNLGYRHMHIHGHLNTIDGFRREYDMELRIHVIDATVFASRYIQRSDPIFLVQKEMERILNFYAQQTMHSTMSRNDIWRIATQEFSAATRAYCGVTIDQVVNADLKLDPSYAEIANINTHTRIEEARLRENVHLSNLELRLQTPLQDRRDEIEMERASRFHVHNRRYEELEGDHLRNQAEQAQRHAIHMDELQQQHNRRQAMQNTYVEGQRSSMEDEMRSGYRVEETWGNRPEIQGAYGSEPQRQLNSPTNNGFRRLPPGGRAGQENTAEQSTPVMRTKQTRRNDETENNEIIEGVTRPVSIEEVSPTPTITVKARRGQDTGQNTGAGSTATTQGGTQIYNALLGATLEILPETQRATLTIHSIALVVQQVEPGGPAHRGNMRSGDFLVHINEQEISNTQILSRILTECEEDTPVTIRVIRDSQFVDLENVIISRRR